MISRAALALQFDALLLDLDGVVYVGAHPVPGVAQALSELTAAGVDLRYVTNNASRPPADVAEQLTGFGLSVAAEDVLTSAQAGAGLVAEHVAPATTVLAVGGPGVATALREAGLRVIDAVTDPMAAGGDDVGAVLQGFGRDVGWTALARAAFAVARGVPWIATNADLTIPVEHGLAPGNGTLVNAVAAATGRSPEIAGKPYPPLLRRAARLSGGRRPLVVGDRLDTDIEGAANAGMPSLLVMTGVTDTLALWQAPDRRRPTFLARDLTGLLQPPLEIAAEGDGSGNSARCGAATAHVDSRSLRVDPGGDPLAAIWVAAHVLWRCDTQPGNTVEVAQQLDGQLLPAESGR